MQGLSLFNSLSCLNQVATYTAFSKRKPRTDKSVPVPVPWSHTASTTQQLGVLLSHHIKAIYHGHARVLQQAILANAGMGDSGPSPGLGLGDLETSRLEIILLATGVLMLVALMSLILWMGVTRRRRQAKPPNPHGRASQACLWKEIFSNPPRHDRGIMAQGQSGRDDPSDEWSFMEQVRRRSASVTGAVQQELSDLRRRISADDVSLPDSELTQRDLSDVPDSYGASTGVTWASANSEAICRRDSLAGREDLHVFNVSQDASPRDRKGEFHGTLDRRHSSWLINLWEAKAPNLSREAAAE